MHYQASSCSHYTFYDIICRSHSCMLRHQERCHTPGMGAAHAAAPGIEHGRINITYWPLLKFQGVVSREAWVQACAVDSSCSRLADSSSWLTKKEYEGQISHRRDLRSSGSPYGKLASSMYVTLLQPARAARGCVQNWDNCNQLPNSVQVCVGDILYNFVDVTSGIKQN